MMPDGYRLDVASAYTALATKQPWKQGDEEVPAWAWPLFEAPGRLCAVGPWLVQEAKQAYSDLRARYPKAREFERNKVIGLSLRHKEAHVVDVDDPELDLGIHPVYLIDGLGRWPATLYGRTGPHPRVLIETESTRYWIAGIEKEDR
jgi:hypothetical protein